MRTGLTSALSLAVMLCFAAAPALAQKKAKKPGWWLAPVAEVVWKDMPKSKVKMSVLWGNPMRGAFGALVKWPAGHEEPLHTHAKTATGVVVSGTVWVTMNGENPKDLASGSTFRIPGRKKHTAGCKEECVFFVHMPGKFNFKPVKVKKMKAAKKEDAPKKEEGEKKAE